MAKSKKSKAKSKKTAKKTAKKSAKKSAKKVAKRAPAPALTLDDRNRMLKPRTGADELVARIVETWAERGDVRVEGLTRARLTSLARKAEAATQREQKLADAQARKLRPLTDARFVADDALWRAVLDVYREVKHRGARDASLADAFAFLADAFKGERSAAPEDEPTTP